MIFNKRQISILRVIILLIWIFIFIIGLYLLRDVKFWIYSLYAIIVIQLAWITNARMEYWRKSK